MKSFAVIGCGRFGSSVARTLNGLGYEVMAIDIDEETIQEISAEVTHSVVLDVMDEISLKDLGIGNFDVVVVSIGSNTEASIMATIIAKELGVEKVVVKAASEFQGKVLAKIGADKVIFPERDMGIRVAHNLVSTNVLEFIELSPDYGIIEITALSNWVGKTLMELQLPSKHNINVIAIKNRDRINVVPESTTVIRENDALVIIASTTAINKIERKAGK
ncbi:TrkA family potassium uptake protein [Tissierella sp. Yu-01]|uniref:potassium channel family protein n=1 Tax=Tissierella sp. Yu-01 TaxID=3035694 RepID=UPI00240DA5CD|nr:TrkA family potassium uptake protein [Tissierella sp. Yu-01]WFA09881.1 TrkA family potassium uptake protein [Tissierella sp. Yu-01]